MLAPNGRVEVLARVLCVGRRSLRARHRAPATATSSPPVSTASASGSRPSWSRRPSTSSPTLVSPACRNPYGRLTNPRGSGGGTWVVARRPAVGNRLPTARPTTTSVPGSLPAGRRWAPRSSPASASRPRSPSSAVAVNFTKGCYPGQELVERMDSRRSQAPRQLRIVSVGAGAQPGDPVADPDDPAGAPVGEITSVAGGTGARLREARRGGRGRRLARPAAERLGGRAPWRTPGCSRGLRAGRSGRPRSSAVRNHAAAVAPSPRAAAARATPHAASGVGSAANPSAAYSAASRLRPKRISRIVKRYSLAGMPRGKGWGRLTIRSASSRELCLAEHRARHLARAGRAGQNALVRQRLGTLAVARLRRGDGCVDRRDRRALAVGEQPLQLDQQEEADEHGHARQTVDERRRQRGRRR